MNERKAARHIFTSLVLALMCFWVADGIPEDPVILGSLVILLSFLLFSVTVLVWLQYTKRGSPKPSS